MNTFLWTHVSVAGVNTLLALWFGITGSMPPRTNTARALDAILTAAFGAWALWLLAVRQA